MTVPFFIVAGGLCFRVPLRKKLLLQRLGVLWAKLAGLE